MAARFTLEIAAGSLASALAAQAGGADRVELCEGLEYGGTTPSYGTLASARERVRLPLFVLVRPRPGDFLYDDAETEVMLHDIEQCVRLGCDGVVIGALNAEGGVDMPRCRALVAAAGPLAVTFHRAFDAARAPLRALENIIDLGCRRVLSSGAQAGAPQGAALLAACVQQAGERLAVMPGAGIDAGNIAALARATGAREFHASAKAVRASSMRFRNRALAGLAPDWQQTDPARVRALRDALDRLA
ncbi:copper homeostasis protein CutC [Stenotrophomonas sp. NLF4-10]|uniref:copper homeostasis protein CutC n=1 Tax=Stenotrophomonas sp. NLF4-10 TaxID=2918754 RepID=UPI001EFAEBA4|nr:copper homeostasis protein CutC [Stenotrophomonas sp. NLF4-10]MCG8274759.1 copper homeostasis protein CutC [Stenotrophomonas sp. NLF4-10]MCG8277989.1 copper homeostasis protein CutC [Stenotrophomonas sp. NLF4-10]MCG8278002.1 copper homeostasis protein CutC [Stenotrophomonas sp. NLF4-10]